MENKVFTPESVNQQISRLLAIPSGRFANQKDAMRFALSILDLTTLEGSDNSNSIKALCDRAKSFTSKSLPVVAAVCVYPVFVKQAKEALKDTNINIASVAGAFPSGQSPIDIKLQEVRYAVNEGADEIDMVISRGKFLEGKFEEVSGEIKAVKQACGIAHLKVILETGELSDLNMIYKASMLAMEAGADFIKTSTGKIAVSATLEASYVMLTAIRDYYEQTGRKVGFKPAGGISTVKQANEYLQLVEGLTSADWLNADLFRIGASRLASNLEIFLLDNYSENMKNEIAE